MYATGAISFVSFQLLSNHSADCTVLTLCIKRDLESRELVYDLECDHLWRVFILPNLSPKLNGEQMIYNTVFSPHPQ